MAENRFPCGASNSSAPKETVCIDTNRILDSCRDRDCFEEVYVHLTDFGNDVIERASNVRAKSSCITGAYVGVEPVQFNRGFYTVIIKFYVRITFEACIGGGRSQEFDGIAVVEKRVILYGGENNVNVFKSNPMSDYCALPEPCCNEKAGPQGVVEVVDPIILSTKVVDRPCDCCCMCDIPDNVAAGLNGTFGNNDSRGRYIVVALGFFSVVRLVRPAQYVINASEYSVPDKECVPKDDSNPCCAFRNMPFPMSEFGSSHITPPRERCCGS